MSKKKAKTYHSRESLFAVSVPVEEVEAWGGVVRVRGMTGDEFAACVDAISTQPTGNRRQRRNGESPAARVSMREVIIQIATQCVIDENGDRIFTDDDREAVGQLPADGLVQVFQTAQRLSGMSEDDVDDLAQEMIERPLAGSSSA